MAVQFYSCFISYARLDDAFVQRLFGDLEANGVSCWKDSEDMAGGGFWRAQISQAIKKFDKLIIVCSQSSLGRVAVVDEVFAAIEALVLADSKIEAGEWREDWVRYVRAYHIPDFSQWREEDAYRREMARLLRDLQNPNVR
jgi:hypothetical protein